MTNFEKIKNELENLEEIYPICYIAVHKLGLSRNDGECDDTCCQKCEKEAFKWLLEEYKEPILTDNEAIIIKNIIKAFEPFKNDLAHITKSSWNGGATYYLYFECSDDDNHDTPNFNGDELFKGMEPEKKYTLKELGL